MTEMFKFSECCNNLRRGRGVRSQKFGKL